MIGGGAPGQLYLGGQVLARSRTFTVQQPGGQQLVTNPSFEAGALGLLPAPWTQFLANGAPAPTTLATQNGWASDGAQSCRITTGTHGANNQAVDLIQAAIAVVAGAPYQLSADFNILAMPNTMIARVLIEWHDGSGAFISQSLGNSVTALGVGRSVVSATAPPTAATGRAIIIVTGGTGVADLYVDNVLDAYLPPLTRVVQRTISATQSQTPTVKHAITGTLAPTQAQATSVRADRGDGPRLVTQSQAGSVSRVVLRPFTLTHAQTVRLAGLATRILALTHAQTVRLAGLATRILAVTQLAALVRAAAVSRTLGGSQPQTPTVRPAALAGRIVAVTQLAAIVRKAAAGRAIGVSQTQATAKSAGHPPIALTQAATPATRRGLSKQIALTQAASLATRRGLSGQIVLTQATTASVTAAVTHLKARTFTLEQPAAPASAAVIGRRVTLTQLALARTLALNRTRALTQPQAPRTVRMLTAHRAASQDQTGRVCRQVRRTQSLTAGQQLKPLLTIARLLVLQSASPTVTAAALARTIRVAQAQHTASLGPVPVIMQGDGPATVALIGDYASRPVLADQRS